MGKFFWGKFRIFDMIRNCHFQRNFRFENFHYEKNSILVWKISVFKNTDLLILDHGSDITKFRQKCRTTVQIRTVTVIMTHQLFQPIGFESVFQNCTNVCRLRKFLKNSKFFVCANPSHGQKRILTSRFSIFFHSLALSTNRPLYQSVFSTNRLFRLIGFFDRSATDPRPIDFGSVFQNCTSDCPANFTIIQNFCELVCLQES